MIYMAISKIREVVINNQPFQVWNEYGLKQTVAKNRFGKLAFLTERGYLKDEKIIKSAIIEAFNLNDD